MSVYINNVGFNLMKIETMQINIINNIFATEVENVFIFSGELMQQE